MVESAQEKFIPDHMFDGGDLDCGSGLILLIRENMLQVPDDGILEMRSREKTVAGDLPPWCRMSGHEYLGSEPAADCTRYFIRKGQLPGDTASLEKDKAEAKKFEWRLRTRATGHLKSTVYVRNFSFDVGQAVSFEEKDQFPSALEYLLGALSGSLTTGFATECAKNAVEIDDIEISLSATLENVLAHLGLEEGDPAVREIHLKCFAATFADEDQVRSIWQQTLTKSPVYATLAKAVTIHCSLVFV